MLIKALDWTYFKPILTSCFFFFNLLLKDLLGFLFFSFTLKPNKSGHLLLHMELMLIYVQLVHPLSAVLKISPLYVNSSKLFTVLTSWSF